MPFIFAIFFITFTVFSPSPMDNNHLKCSGGLRRKMSAQEIPARLWHDQGSGNDKSQVKVKVKVKYLQDSGITRGVATTSAK